MTRVLLCATTTGYQTRMFEEAAAELGVELLYATDRCDQLDDPWRDGAIAVRYHDEWTSTEAVVEAVKDRPVHGVVAVGDRPAVLAAYVARRLGLGGHPPEAALVARDKRRQRAALAAAGLPVPWHGVWPAATPPDAVAASLAFPVVIKPTVLSASRGVIRADDHRSFVMAWERVRRLLASPDIVEMRDPEADLIQVEAYVPGVEYALEGLMTDGRLQVLAVFDKPDPLDGPFFEETIYVTPTRAGSATLAAIEAGVAAAAAAIGLHDGPVHAECRVNGEGVFVLEAAARPIGGLCARALRFVDGRGGRCGLESLILRHAIGERTDQWRREDAASAVMMVPIPRAGVFRGVDGVEEARAVPGIDDIRITAKPDQRLVPLPEGASYLGFIFAHAAAPAEAESRVRDAHAALRFAIDPVIPVERR